MYYNSTNELYLDNLFGLISSLTMLPSAKDWECIKKGWKTEYYKFLGTNIISQNNLDFLELCGCFKNQRLKEFSRSTCWDIISHYDKIEQGDLNILENENFDLKIFLNFIAMHKLFSKDSPSFEKTYLMLRFARPLLNPMAIMNDKVSLT
jgi:hypothetical protein